ncbi:MAG: rRNA adenine N(6)-methyltransferase family protein, partial [Actinocatenispora sp.]
MRARRPAGNPSGVHFLSARPVIAALLRSARLGPGQLVVEFGAGPGIITAPLARTGARVLAVERDAEFVRRLHRRFADQPSVRVVHADLRTVPLPRRAYHVVANLPFAVSTATLRRLLDPADTPVAGADLIVEWGLARRLSQVSDGTTPARDAGTAWWAARFDLRLARRIPASAFSPAPRVDAAHLVIRPRPLPRSATRHLSTLLRAGYRMPERSVQAVLSTVVPPRRAHRIARSTGIPPPTPTNHLTVPDW